MPYNRIIRNSFLILLIFIVSSPPLFTQQPVSAGDDPHFARIDSSVSTASGSFQNGATIGVASGDFGARVIFQYYGADDNRHVRYFECSFDGQTYLRSHCPIASGQSDSRMSVQGPDGIVRAYPYVLRSSVEHLYVSGPQFFGVKIVDENGQRSQPSILRFTVDDRISVPGSDRVAPVITITSVLDGNRAEIMTTSQNLPSYEGVTREAGTTSQALTRVSFTISDDVNIRSYSCTFDGQQIPCGTPLSAPTRMLTDHYNAPPAPSLLALGMHRFCVNAEDTFVPPNRGSSCFGWLIRSADPTTTINLRAVHESYGDYLVDITLAREVVERNLNFIYDISPAVVRACTTLAPLTSIPSNPSALNYNYCLRAEGSVSSTFNFNLILPWNQQRNIFQTICFVAYNTQDVRSSPSCFTYFLSNAIYVEGRQTGIFIDSREPIEDGFDQVPFRGSTTSTELGFFFNIHNPLPDRISKVYCRWDQPMGTFGQCGAPLIICPVHIQRQADNTFTQRVGSCFVPQHMFMDIVRNLSLGQHNLEMLMRHDNTGYRGIYGFNWCNVQEGSPNCIGPRQSPISLSSVLSQSLMRTSNDLNTTSSFTSEEINDGLIPDFKVLPYAGEDQTIYLNNTTNVDLNGSLLVTPSEKILFKLFNNNSSSIGNKILDQEIPLSPEVLKPIQDEIQDRLASMKVKWSQISGPPINLKDVESWRTQFAVPSLKEDTQFQLKMEIVIDDDKISNKTLSDTVNISVITENTKNQQVSTSNK